MRLLIRSQSTTTTQLLTQWMSNIVRMDKEGWVESGLPPEIGHSVCGQFSLSGKRSHQ
jgi:hypothetical protein